MSDCRGCGGTKVTLVESRGWDPYADTRPNERGIYELVGDDGMECEPYHGAYRGASIFVVGQGVEGKERLFLRSMQQQAEDYAIAEKLLMVHRSVVQFCHDPIFALIGA